MPNVTAAPEKRRHVPVQPRQRQWTHYKWVRANHCREAAIDGYFEVVTRARWNECPWDETTYTAATVIVRLD